MHVLQEWLSGELQKKPHMNLRVNFKIHLFFIFTKKTIPKFFKESFELIRVNKNKFYFEAPSAALNGFRSPIEIKYSNTNYQTTHPPTSARPVYESNKNSHNYL